MSNPSSFGRRAARAAPVWRASPTDPQGPAPAPPPSAATAQDEELEKWRQTRNFRLPWRQLSWMATLCFGLASLVLPDSVNNAVQWLLHFLTAASLCSGLMGRSKAGA